MGCFGDMTPVQQTSSSSTTSPPAWVSQAGQQNYNAAQNYFNQGFVPYTGQLTAPLAPNQTQANSLVSTAPVNPNAATAAGNFNAAGNAPAYNYDFSTAVDPNSPLGSIQSYMDPYTAGVLSPTLQQLSLTNAQNQNQLNSSATMSGAFGDSRQGVAQAQQAKDYNTAVTDATNQAYSQAFNSAMSNRQQDLSRNLTTQQSQEAADEAALARKSAAGSNLQGLDTSTTGNITSLANALGQTGATAQTTQQAADTANYNQFLRQQGWTDQQIALLTSILSGTPQPTTTTGSQTTSQPDNSGFQMIGSLASALLL